MIEVGEYVRTKAGQIDKVINNQYYLSAYIECKNDVIWRNGILNHSKNIIDLIEVGDLIKYKLKNLQHYSYGIVHITKDPRSLKETLRIGLYEIESVEILEILTKKQYESNCYKVKEE